MATQLQSKKLDKKKRLSQTAVTSPSKKSDLPVSAKAREGPTKTSAITLPSDSISKGKKRKDVTNEAKQVDVSGERKRAKTAEVVPSVVKDSKAKRKEAEKDVEMKESEAVVSIDGEGAKKKKRAAKAAEVDDIEGSVGVTKGKGKETKVAEKGKPKKVKNIAFQTTPASISDVKKSSSKSVKPPRKLAPPPDPSSEASASDVDPTAEDAADDSDEESVHLHGFSDDDEDSSDEEGLGLDHLAIDVGKLPTIAKDDATIQRRLEKAKRQQSEHRGVIYLGRLPHGFFEDQMKAYFSQFGEVTRLRLSRSKKTGRSKHYAFIEFSSVDVAQIVAETMDNYLLMGHIIRCKLIPKDEVHPELWVGANKKWRVIPRDRIARQLHNKLRTEEEQQKAEQRLLKRQEAKKRKLEEAGIKYDISKVAYKKSKATQ